MSDPSYYIIYSRNWVYFVSGNDLFLYYIDELGNIEPPYEDITDGLLIEYKSSGSVFTNSDGLIQDTPDQDSTVNVTDIFLRAIIQYVKADLQGDIRMKEYEMKEFRRLKANAISAMSPSVGVPVPSKTFGIYQNHRRYI